MNRKNGKIWRIVAIAVTFLLALTVVVYGYGRLSEKVEQHDKSIVKMERDLEYIKASVIRIEAKLDGK